MRLLALTTVLSLTLAYAVACSSSDPDVVERGDDAGMGDAMVEGDANVASDAGGEDANGSDSEAGASEPDPLPAVTGALEVKAAGNLPTTAKTGVVALAGGSAQWRPAPFGGGVLCVLLAEEGVDGRIFEITVYDGDDTPAVEEKFGAVSGNSAPIDGARFETYGASKSWRAGGDGQVVVKAFSDTSVTLALVGVGQFVHPTGSDDVFVVEGTVTVPIVALRSTSGGSVGLAVSNQGPEPITSEPLNLTDPSKVPSAAPSLGEEEFPYVGKRRAVRSNDGAGSSARRLLLSFPSGHLPHAGQTIALNTFDRVMLSLIEGATFKGETGEKYWEADQGTLTVESRTATAITVKVQGARMQSESPAAKGVFTLDGTLQFMTP